MPYKDPEKRRIWNRKYSEQRAQAQGRELCEKAGRQPKIPRCDNCPDKGGPCKDCYNAHRRTYRTRAGGYTKVYRSPSRPGRKKVKVEKPRYYRHKQAVIIKPRDEFLVSDLFSCPGCMRKLRGEWRYCERCEARRNV